MADWTELVDNKEAWKSLKYNDPRLDSFAHAVEDRYGIPRGVIEAIKNAGERTPNKDGKTATSHMGAQGWMQFMPSTRKEYQHNPDDPFESIDAAGRYIADLMKHPSVRGNPLAAIGWYNGGKYAAEAINAGKPPPAQETRDYISRIRDYMEKRYGGGE